MTIFYLFIFSAFVYGPRAFPAELGAYLQDLGENRRAKPVVSLQKNSSATELFDARFSPTPKPAALAKVTFIEGHWSSQDSEPCLVVEEAGERFCLRLGSRYYYHSAAEDLLRKLGLPAPPRRLVQGLQIDISAEKKVVLARFMGKIPVRYNWAQNFTDTPGGMKVEMAVLEPLWKRKGSWKWSELQKSAPGKRMLLTLAWMQCSLIRQNRDHARIELNGQEFLGIENLRGCLGIGASVSSPNMFAGQWVTADPAGLKFDNPFFDDAYLEAFASLGRADLEEFYARAAHLTESDLTAIFEGNGFPASLARLYALKLMGRLATLGNLLGHAPPSFVPPSRFTSPPHILEGNVVENYESFPADLTQSALEQLIWELGRKALKPIDELARQLISTMPFASMELVQMGKFHFAPGFMFRMSRTITENPKPTGAHDLFLVRDEIDLSVTAGLGLDRDFYAGGGWANAGGGYRRVYVKIHPAPSRKAANESFWSIPYDALWMTNFDTLKPGEVLAIQGGWLVMAVAGGTLLRGAWIRPSGYVMGSYEWLDTFQVAHLPDGGFILAEGYDTGWFFQAKSYWRVKSRYLRVPFAGWNWKNADQTARSVTVGADQLNSADENARLKAERLLLKALTDRNLDELAKEIPPVNRQSHINSTSSFYNFYYLQGTHGKSQTQVRLEPLKGEFEVMRASNTFKDLWTGAKRGWSCESAALLSRESAGAWPQDGFLQLNCVLDMENPSQEDLSTQLRSISQNLGVELPAALPKVKGTAREFILHLRIEMPWRSLAPIMSDELTGWVKETFDTAMRQAETETSEQSMIRGLPRFHFLMQLSGIRAVRDPSKRLLQFVQAMNQMGIQEPMMADFLREIPDKYMTIKILDQTSLSTETMDKLLVHGQPFAAPLRKIYEDHFLSYENLVVNTF